MPPYDSSEIIQAGNAGLSAALTPTQRVQAFLDHNRSRHDYHGFDKSIINKDLELISAGSGETVFKLIVKEAHAGTAGTLHVGAAALIFDVCTTTALIPIASPGFWQYLGVSRNLNVTYLHPAPVGTTLIITSTVVSAGRKLVTIRGVAVNKDDGRAVCTMEHLKFNAEPAPEKL